MAQNENVNLIQSLYAAFARGDADYILSRVTSDVDWISEGPPSIPHAGTYRGYANVQRFFETMSKNLDGARVNADEFVSEGNKVVATGRFTATVKATGKRIDSPIAHVFTLRDGKIARWVGYSDTARVADAYAASVKRATT